MTDAEFLRIADHMKSKYGIDLYNKKAIVEGRLANTILRGGYGSVSEYINDIVNDKTGAGETELVNILTTNHTYFMREFDHLEYLKNVILPELKQKEELRKDLRIWCAAASTGEEPYMIAMTVLSFFGFEHAGWDTKILATDVSKRALEIAIRGRYSSESIDKVSDIWKKRFFKKVSGEDDLYEITDEVKNEVLFRQFNLMSPFPFKRKMHVIFLRNVMIYFDQATKNELLEKVYDYLEPGGYLIIGKTEAIDTHEIPFETVGASIFRKP